MDGGREGGTEGNSLRALTPDVKKMLFASVCYCVPAARLFLMITIR